VYKRQVLLSALGGLMWYLQFFFYAWGHARIPAQYDYISWMLHMSFYVLCGGIVGLVLKEWNNACLLYTSPSPRDST
ncbi:L-rhamnose/proton symporter RhaT, partial [Escherichia coli]